jgi:serine/threonine kinase PknH
VAIKVLSAKLSEDEDFQQRFRREAHAAARLETPHVVPIYDYGEIDGRLFVSMRLIKGRDLATVLSDGPLEPARAARIIGQVAEALHAAHEIGLIHRDIKPSNILLDDRDFPYLIDFGIARGADDTRLTKTGNTIGTFAYIAPERLEGRAEDARVDIYSLACVLYECLAGAPPFEGDTMARLVAAHLTSPPPRPSINQPNVPSEVDEVIATGMAKDPDERYATTVELADAARDAITVPISRPARRPAFLAATKPAGDRVIAEPNPATTRPGSPPASPPEPADDQSPADAAAIPLWRQRRPALIAAAIVALVVVAGTTGYLLRPNSPATPTQTAHPPTTASATATPAGPRPVVEAGLDGLLLDPDQINAAMGASGMKVDQIETSMDEDTEVVDKACLPADGNLVAPVYAGSGWTALREQIVQEPGNNWTHKVDQGVVLFSSAHDADAFFTTSAQTWLACANRQYTKTVAGKPPVVWTVGPVSNTNGTLSAHATSGSGNSSWKWNWSSCQRALTVANNVVIDVTTCSYNRSDAQSASGVNIAHQIAAKVPTYGHHAPFSVIDLTSDRLPRRLPAVD